MANNTSNVTVKVSIYSEASWNNDAATTSGSYCTINGTKYSFTHSFNKGTTEIFTKTLDIPHNADGTKKLSVYASFKTDVSLGTLTKSAEKTLTTIPRASTPTLSATKFDAGSALTITTNRASGSFTHTLTYTLNGTTGDIATGVGSSYTWTAASTKELAGLIPNATSGTLTITCKTYNGSTLIGTKTVSATVTVPETADFMPSISGLGVVDTTGYRDKYGGFVQGKSVPAVTIHASSNYSSIASYNIKFQGVTVVATSNEVTLATVSKTGTLDMEVTVTDSRGRTASSSISITALEYKSPSVYLKVVRCDSDGTSNDDGACIKAICNASVSTLNNKNSKTVKLQYKVKGATSWTTQKTWSAYRVNEEFVITASPDYSYDIQLVATDDFTGTSPITYAAEIGTVETILDFNDSGKGMAIGKVSEKDGLEVGWDATFYKPVTFEGDVTIKGNLRCKKYPTLTQQQKDAIQDLIAEWIAARSNFCYRGDIIMDVYSEGHTTGTADYYDTTDNKFKLNCSTFVQFIMMGRRVADITGVPSKQYSPNISKAFKFGYYFQFKDRKYIYGLHDTGSDGNPVYLGFKNPLNDEVNWKGTYSRNTYYTAGSTNHRKQTFNPFAYANDMAKELYELGCEIPFSELDVGDILFSKENDATVDNSESMFDDVAWRNITHVFMVYEIHESGELKLVECTDTTNTIITSHMASTSKGDSTRAYNLLKNTVMCARMPIAFGIETNVPSAITKLEKPAGT